MSGAQGAPAVTVLGRYGSHPAPGGAGRGLLLQGGGRDVLLGCGSGVAGRLGYHLGGAERLGAVLLPDLRPDHACDLWSVGALTAAAVRRGARHGLLLTYAYGRPAEDWRRLQRPGVLDVRRFAPEDTVRVEGWTFTFAALRHPWPTLAVRAEAGGVAVGLVGPCTDPAEAEALCAGVRLLIVEVGGPEEGDEGQDGGLPPAEAARLALACGAPRLLLAHLEPDEPAQQLLEAAAAVHPAAALALEGRTYAL